MHQNPELLKQLLAKAQESNTDSDKDGVGDIAELKAGTSPNPEPKGEAKAAAPAPAPTAPPKSGSGCGCGAGPLGSFALFGGLSALALLSRRRRS